MTNSLQRRLYLSPLIWFISAGLAYASANNVLNLSSRTFVPSGGNPFIGGFITQGSQPITVILRGIGPSLAKYGFSKVLEDPVIELRDSNGTILQKNDDWVQSPDAQEISAAGLAPSNNVESATLATIPPGSYTTLLYPVPNGTYNGGIGVVEMYDLQRSSSRFGNISSLGFEYDNSERALIAGFIIGGNQQKQIVVRAARRTGDTYSDPRLNLYDGSGKVIASNDDWQQDANAADVQRVGLAPQSPKEAALYRTLSAGNYTVVVQVADPSGAMGLVEIYDVTPAP